MPKTLWRWLVFPLLLLPVWAFSAPLKQDHDPVAAVLFWISLIFLLAMAGRYIAQRFHQPGVLGELLMGVLFGNLCYWLGVEIMIILREGSSVFNIMRGILGGEPLSEAVSQNILNPVYASEVKTALGGIHGIDYIKTGYVLDMFFRFGVIFLLFMVGLESSLEELRHTGRESLTVAVIGVIAPVLLGFGFAWLLMPETSGSAALFVAATLSATSVGITARVLSDLKKLKIREARTILGAAMIDDILGLLILAMVSSIVIDGRVDMIMIATAIVSTVLFFTAALWLGPWLLQRAVRSCTFLEPWQAKLVIAFLFVMLLSWLATVVQLASIIGAFLAGMIIRDSYFDEKGHEPGPRIRDLVAPLEFLLVPLFFMLIGMQVKLEAFFHWHVLLLAGGLILAAIAGKLVSGLGANRKDDRLLVGIGMLPRGEVGLVFASIGRTLGVVSDQLFSAIILMVVVTTVIVPPLLKYRYGKNKVHLPCPPGDVVAVDVARALAEDIGSGDVSAALLPAELKVRADIISREAMLVCGKPWVDAVFSAVSSDIQLEWLAREGEWLASPATLCHVVGPARAVLTAERTALNFLQTLSGTATKTRQFAEAIGSWNTRLLDTRKTLPGLRIAQKYAVMCGGGYNHRMGLYDAFLIKENHIRACGSITDAIKRARSAHPSLLLEVEVETLPEFREALAANPDRIMLDNFTLDMMKEAIALNQSHCELEASGGVSLETIKTVAATGVDYISTGAITKSVKAIDLSLLIRETL